MTTCTLTIWLAFGRTLASLHRSRWKQTTPLAVIERASRYPIAALLIVAIATAALLAGCGSDSAPEPTATPDIAATINAQVSQVLGTPIAQPTVVRPGYCGRLCDDDFLRTAGVADVQDELDWGADIAARGHNGKTPLHEAAIFNTEPAVIALLLDRDADTAAKDDEGQTPLHLAAARNTELTVIALLLDRGADIEAKDDHGLTVCQFAEFANRETDILRLLCR